MKSIVRFTGENTYNSSEINNVIIASENNEVVDYDNNKFLAIKDKAVIDLDSYNIELGDFSLTMTLALNSTVDSSYTNNVSCAVIFGNSNYESGILFNIPISNTTKVLSIVRQNDTVTVNFGDGEFTKTFANKKGRLRAVRINNDNKPTVYDAKILIGDIVLSSEILNTIDNGE